MLASGANIDFRNLNTNHFTTNGYRVSLKNFPTNTAATNFITQLASNYVASVPAGALNLNLTNTVHVSIDGNDSTGIRGSLQRRFQTLWAARSNAVAGDTVVVWSGLYTNGVTNLFKGGVDWHFVHAVLDWTDPTTNGHGSGIFDDRFSGAITSRITGTVTLKYSSGTNGYWDDECIPWFGNWVNALGAIVLTNANSLVSWEANTKLHVYGPTSTPYGLYVKNCKSECFFNINECFGSPFAGNIFTKTNCPADPNTEYNIQVYSSFLYWELGSFHVRFDHIWPMTSYGIAAYGVTNNDVGDMYVEGGIMEGKIYMVGTSPAWKSWITLAQLRTTNQNAYQPQGAGTHYLTAQKVSDAGPGNFGILTGPNAVGDSNQIVHLNIQKVSGGGGWIDHFGGTLVGRIENFEPIGTNITAGIVNRGGNIELSGETASAPRFVIDHRNGSTRLSGYRMRATNNPVAFVSGPGLILQDVSMVSPTNCVTATNAQTMKIYNSAMANTNEHSNVSISMGTLNVNGGVQ